MIYQMKELQLSLYIVAPDERSSKVMFEVNRPTFSRLEPPLSELCSYISFSSLEEAIEKHGSVIRYMKPDFLEKISESCVIDELMSLTLADWFVIQVKVFSFFMITWITSSRPNGLDGHG